MSMLKIVLLNNIVLIVALRFILIINLPIVYFEHNSW